MERIPSKLWVLRRILSHSLDGIEGLIVYPYNKKGRGFSVIILTLTTISINILVILLLNYLVKGMLGYFTYLPLDNIFFTNIIIILVLVNISNLVSKCLPDKYIIFRSLINYPYNFLLLFLEGLISNIFNTSNENIKTIILNSGGSPKITFKWSQISISRYAIFILVFVFLFLIDYYNNNVLNTGLFIPFGDKYKIKYTYGLLILIFILVIFTLRFSTLGIKLNGLCKLFFSFNIFKFFLGGEKTPGVFQKNIFSDPDTFSSNWFSIKTIDNNKYLVANKKDELKCLFLPGFNFSFALGRVLQVLIRILLLAIGLLIFMMLIFTFFNLILNYIDCSEFGNNTYSFYDIIKNKFNLRSITSTWWGNKSLLFKIILPKNPTFLGYIFQFFSK